VYSCFNDDGGYYEENTSRSRVINSRHAQYDWTALQELGLQSTEEFP